MKLSKRRPRLLVLLSMLIASAGLLGGCWDNKDINHRSLPIVMGISKHDHQYRVYLQIPVSNEQDAKLRVISYSGKTITEIVDRISMNMENRVDLLHLKVILIEKGFAELGLTDSIASFIRSRDISPKAMLVICDEDLDSFFDHMQTTVSENPTILYDFFDKSAGWNPSIAQTRVWETFRSIHSYTRDVIIPIVRSGNRTILENVGSAVIRNGKMVDRMSTSETLLFNAFSGESTQGKIEVMNHASVLIVSNTVSHHGWLVDNKPYLRSRINLKVSILETRDDPTVQMIKEELETVETKRFNKMFQRVQRKQADILGIGQFFRTDIPRSKLAHWRTDYYPYTKLDLKVNAIIQNEGNLKSIEK